MPATNVRSHWSGGDLIFHEALSARPLALYNILTIGDDAVTVGSATNDIDFKIFLGAADQYALFDWAAATITFAKVDVALSGDLTVTVEDISVAQGKYIYTEGQGGASYLISDAAGDLMLNTTTNINFAFGGTDEVRLTATVFSPATSDGNALGSTSLMWSDLFLASEGVINFNNGNCAITHAAGVLTVTGDIVASNAAGPAFEDEAATNTNPTLCPNKAELDTGIGWTSTDIVNIVLGGANEYAFSTSALDMNGNHLDNCGYIVLNASTWVTGETGVWNETAGELHLNAVTGKTVVVEIADAAEYTLSATGIDMNANTITDVGDIECTDAAGPTLQNEAATTTNPTLIPNRADETTGIGWNTAQLVGVVSGAAVVTLAAATVTFAQKIVQDDATNSTSGTTGSIQTDGGLGVALNTFLAGNLTVGATTAGADVSFYSDVALVGVFWDHDGDTNSGIWSFGVTGGSKGTDVFFYGDTNGAYAQWDSDADDLLLVGAGLYFSGTQADEVIKIGGTYDHGIYFTEDMVAGDVTNSFINIGDYTNPIAVVPAGANMFGVMHNVTMATDVAYWYQAYYTKITTSGTTDTTSIAGHAYRMVVGSDLAAVYGVQSHVTLSGARTFTSEVTPGSFYLDVGTTSVSAAGNRVNALQAVLTGGATVTGEYAVMAIYAATNATPTDLLYIGQNSTVTSNSAIQLELDGTCAYAFDFEGTVSDAWTTATAGTSVTPSAEYVLIPVDVKGTTNPLFLLAAQTWTAA